MKTTPKLAVAKVIYESEDVSLKDRIKYLKELKDVKNEELATWLEEQLRPNSIVNARIILKNRTGKYSDDAKKAAKEFLKKSKVLNPNLAADQSKQTMFQRAKDAAMKAKGSAMKYGRQGLEYAKKNKGKTALAVAAVGAGGLAMKNRIQARKQQEIQQQNAQAARLKR